MGENTDTEEGPSGFRTENVVVNGTSLYIGNLPYSYRWQELKDLFKQAGEVAYADIPRDGYRSRGFGIVRFNNVAEAQKAVDMFNNYELNGRIINVREDNSPRDFKAPTKPRTFGGNNGGSTRPAGGNNGGFAAAKAGTKVFVGNLPWSVTWQTLKDLAKEKGLNPIRAEVAIGDNGKSRGWGTLQFDSTDEADAAIDALNGEDVSGRQIEVRLDQKA